VAVNDGTVCASSMVFNCSCLLPRSVILTCDNTGSFWAAHVFVTETRNFLVPWMLPFHPTSSSFTATQTILRKMYFSILLCGKKLSWMPEFICTDVSFAITLFTGLKEIKVSGEWIDFRSLNLSRRENRSIFSYLSRIFSWFPFMKRKSSKKVGK